MRFEKRHGRETPCGAGCHCYEKMRIVVVKDDGTVIKNYADKMAYAVYGTTDYDAGCNRYEMALAFLERAYAKQQARIEQEQGAAALTAILNDSAFSVFDEEASRELLHEVIYATDTRTA